MPSAGRLPGRRPPEVLLREGWTEPRGDWSTFIGWKGTQGTVNHWWTPSRGGVASRDQFLCEIATIAAREGYVAMTMKIEQQLNIWSVLLLLSCVLLLSCATAQAQKKSKYVCDEAQPESIVQCGQHLRFGFVCVYD